jgi:hypothetical protein
LKAQQIIRDVFQNRMLKHLTSYVKLAAGLANFCYEPMHAASPTTLENTEPVDTHDFELMPLPCAATNTTIASRQAEDGTTIGLRKQYKKQPVTRDQMGSSAVPASASASARRLPTLASSTTISPPSTLSSHHASSSPSDTSSSVFSSTPLSTSSDAASSSSSLVSTSSSPVSTLPTSISSPYSPRMPMTPWRPPPQRRRHTPENELLEALSGRVSAPQVTHFLDALSVSEADCARISGYEQLSVGWFHHRKYRITASHFGAAAGTNSYQGRMDVLEAKLWPNSVHTKSCHASWYSHRRHAGQVCG